MANDKIGIDEPSAIDKYLDTESLVVGIDTVHRERTQIAGAAAAEIARVGNADPNPADYALAVRAIPSATATPVSAAALPLPAGAATGAKQDTGNASLGSIDGKVLTDTQLRASAVPVSGPLTDAQLRAAAVPVSAAALPLPAGASTGARQDTEIASLASIDAKLGGTLNAAIIGAVEVMNDAGNPLPVSGTVTATGPLTDAQLRAAPVPVSAAALPLPTGAATEAKQDVGNTSLASIDAKTPALGQALMSASTPVTMASDQDGIYDRIARRDRESQVIADYDARIVAQSRHASERASTMDRRGSVGMRGSVR